MSRRDSLESEKGRWPRFNGSSGQPVTSWTPRTLADRTRDADEELKKRPGESVQHVDWMVRLRRKKREDDRSKHRRILTRSATRIAVWPLSLPTPSQNLKLLREKILNRPRTGRSAFARIHGGVRERQRSTVLVCWPLSLLVHSARPNQFILR